MSSEPPDADEKIHEIVIVRRRSDHDDDDHHGGVWKVAFADFMTAMMAFFLVLWIVNSTTKETRNSLARYFNPVRLSDTTPARRGLKDPKEDQFDAKGAAVQGKEHQQRERKRQELEGTARDVDERDISTAGRKETSRANADKSTGEAEFDDPFLVRAHPGSDMSARESAAAASKPGDQGRDAGPGPELTRAAAALMSELRKRLGKERSAELGEALTVLPDRDGILISLTDKSDFGMFAVGSFAPQMRLIETLAAIAEILGRHKGSVIIRGHTDSRPYRGGDIDNWRLSSLRAWAAFQILVKNGLADERVERIEGYADHQPKVRADGQAPQNRRIEILVRAGEA